VEIIPSPIPGSPL
jgi:hypothetical protein